MFFAAWFTGRIINDLHMNESTERYNFNIRSRNRRNKIDYSMIEKQKGRYAELRNLFTQKNRFFLVMRDYKLNVVKICSSFWPVTRSTYKKFPTLRVATNRSRSN